MLRLLIASVALLLAVLPSIAVSPADSQGVPAARRGDKVAVITIEGPIWPTTAQSFERRVQLAVDGGADVIVVELDTPGGEVFAALEICTAIKAAPVYTTAWVNPDAFSAGAIIALSCNEIVLGPGATMGDAVPIAANPITGIMELPENERAKLLSPLIAEVVDSARRNGYDENLVLGYLTLGIETWKVRDRETGEVYFLDEQEYSALFGSEPPRGGKPLNVSGFEFDDQGSITDRFPTPTELRDDFSGAAGLSGERAVVEDPFEIQTEATLRPDFTRVDAQRFEYVGYATDGKGPFTLKGPELVSFGFVDSGKVIRNDEELKQHHGATQLKRLDMSWSERMVSFLNFSMWGWAIRGLLVVVFLVALFVELLLPGTGGGGVVAVLALAGLIVPSLMVGAHAWWALALILVGLGLLAAEIFVLPGFGVPAAAGALCLIIGLIASFAGAGQLFPGSGVRSGSDLSLSVAIVLVAIFAAILIMWYLSRFTHSLPIARRLMLSTAQERYTNREESLIEAMGPKTTDGVVPLGAIGVTLAPLHPGGTAEFDGRLVDVVSEDGWIDEGETVRVIDSNKYRVAVLRVDGSLNDAPEVGPNEESA